MASDGKKRKLYLVDLKMQVVVWAADTMEATAIAEESAGEELMNSGMEADFVRDLERPEDIPAQWVHSLPYRADGDERYEVAGGTLVQYEPTCSQILGE